MNKIFIDLDGVIVDFEKLATERKLAGDVLKQMPGIYLEMKPIKGAISAVESLIGMGWEVWIATKPPTGIPHAYADKAEWVMINMPFLKRKIIITHNKGLLGDEDDFLIDDRIHKAKCKEFKGQLIHYSPVMQWPEILRMFRKIPLVINTGWEWPTQ